MNDIYHPLVELPSLLRTKLKNEFIASQRKQYRITTRNLKTCAWIRKYKVVWLHTVVNFMFLNFVTFFSVVTNIPRFFTTTNNKVQKTSLILNYLKKTCFYQWMSFQDNRYAMKRNNKCWNSQKHDYNLISLLSILGLLVLGIRAIWSSKIVCTIRASSS